ELPPEIDAVTTKMLAKLPDERFASVADAMTAMEAAVSSKGGPAVTTQAAVVPSSKEPTLAAGPAPALMTATAPTAPTAPMIDNATPLPSPRRDAVALESPASSPRSNRTLPIAIGVGAASLVGGFVLFVLVVRWCGTPTTPSPEPAA